MVNILSMRCETEALLPEQESKEKEIVLRLSALI